MKIINLSKYILNDVEQAPLQGSKFCHTPLLELEIDIHKIARGLLLKKLSTDNTNNSAETSLVKKRGEFIPQKAKDSNLDLIEKNKPLMSNQPITTFDPLSALYNMKK